jgi:hypothetical protein
LSTSQISPATQSFYGGGIPAGTVSSASPTAGGMRADEIAAITVGSVAVAGLIGFGIYRFMKKDKPRSEGSEDKISPEMEAFGSAYKDNDIRNSDRLFKQLSPQEKKDFIIEGIEHLNAPDELGIARKMFFVFCDGNLPSEIDQAFINKAKSLNIDPDEIDLNKDILSLRSLSDNEQLSALNRWITELKSDDSSGILIQQVKDILELYYDKFLKPEISTTTHESVRKLAAKELHINFH